MSLSGSEAEAAPQRGGAWKIVLRLVVGVGVFSVLVLRDPSALLHALKGVSPVWAIAGVGVFLAGLIVSAFRWRAYLEALELPLPVATLLRLYFVGTFFNAFLPTGVGGDAYKAVRIARARGRGVEAFASVFLDRFAGVVALAFVGMTGTLIELFAGDPSLRVASVSIVLAGGIITGASVVLLFGDRIAGHAHPGEQGLVGKLRRALRAIHAAARHPRAAARGYLLGFVFQGLILAAHVTVAHALHVTGVSVAALAGIVVITSMATMIPVTVNGLGFREGAYVWALGTFGVPQPQARAFAIMILAILLIASLIGGVVYVVAGGEVAAGSRDHRSGTLPLQ